MRSDGLCDYCGTGLFLQGDGYAHYMTGLPGCPTDGELVEKQKRELANLVHTED